MRIEIHRWLMAMASQDDGSIAVAYDVLVPLDDCLPNHCTIRTLLTNGRAYQDFAERHFVVRSPAGLGALPGVAPARTELRPAGLAPRHAQDRAGRPARHPRRRPRQLLSPVRRPSPQALSPHLDAEPAAAPITIASIASASPPPPGPARIPPTTGLHGHRILNNSQSPR